MRSSILIATPHYTIQLIFDTFGAAFVDLVLDPVIKDIQIVINKPVKANPGL